MAGRLKDAIKKRASRLLHRNRDGAKDTPEGADSHPSNNRNSLNYSSRKSQPGHRKSLSLLSRSSKTEPKNCHVLHQTQAPESTNGYQAHPAVQPLDADLQPKTPRLERQRPGIKSDDSDDQSTDGNAQGSDYFEGSSSQAAQHYQPKQEKANRPTHQSTRPANSPDAAELERRLSRLAVSRQGTELPEIDIAPLTPFEYVEKVDPVQAKPSRLAIGQDGPEKASTHIEPLSQESDVNLHSNASQEVKHSLEAIHPRDAEFDRINKEVQAGTDGEANFHLQNSLDFDRTIHNQDPVVHESIRPHVHTIYEPKRTLSIHHHEHRRVIQPIKDPNPTILPDQHWLRDDTTGEFYRIPAELGKQLM
ncbi:hypothetical protein HYE67_005936 [Fusarium culmorum]|uniref:Uncharacterized protein n=1 Tax=Fusarium culmorum TaxID=5516 RepID=A0A2T4GD48_FUSCU|nr:hypothetical protein FCULG_00010284 [Fusarium culmorum]QPC63705.1 hypothetical protein HYE67_005936 [Fusarium culmorum]